MPDKRKLIDVATGQSLAAIVAEDPWVSQLDRWSSDRWRLDGDTPGERRFTLYWKVAAHPDVIDRLKYLAACYFIGPNGVPAAKYSNANSFGVGVRYLARFMEAKTMRDFASLDREAFSAFKRHLDRTLKDPADDPEAFRTEEEPPEGSTPEGDDAPGWEGGSDGGENMADGEDDLAQQDDPDDEAPPPEPDDEGYGGSHEKSAAASKAKRKPADRLTFSIAVNRLLPWKIIHDQRHLLARAGIGRLPFDPFADSSLIKTAQSKAERADSTVAALPDEVAIPILNEAYRMLGQPAEDVIQLQERYLALREPSRGPRRKATAQAMRKVLTGFEFGFAEGQSERWHAPLFLPGRQNSGAIELKDLVESIRDAAVIVLLAGVGWRLSEICSVEVDDRAIGGALPSCIRTAPSATHTSEHFIIDGLLTKHRASSDPEEWLIGARGAGSATEPMTVRAVRVLERLLQPWRRLAGSGFASRRLLVTFLHAKGLPSSPSSVRTSGDQIRSSMRKFIATRVGLQEKLEPLLATRPELRSYHSSKGLYIRPHQWRHTFYSMLMHADDRLLPAISEQFKHTSIARTENSYGAKRADDRVAQDRASLARTVSFFQKRRGGEEKPVGNLDKEMRRHAEAFAELISDFPLDTEAERIEEFCLVHDLRLWPAEHGNCLIGLNPDKAACHTVGGRIDWRAERPNLGARSPGLCSGCPNFSIDREHAPFWRRRFIQYRTAWIGSGRVPAFRFAFERARQAEAVLKALKVPLPPIPTDDTNDRSAA